jgi:predicted Zn-dependent protease
MSRILFKSAPLLLLPLFAGCGQGGGGGVALPSLGSGTTLGSLIGGRTGQLADAGGKGLSAMTMSEADEDEMGRSVAIAATNQWPLYDNPALTKYVTMVGLTLADATSNPSGNWVFGILDTPDLGAYSGPNGYILITRGAIAAMRDELELAGVIAHEMAHVLNHDGFQAVKNAKLSEAVAEGDEKSVNDLLARVKKGPRAAVVKGVEEAKADAAEKLAPKFEIRDTAEPPTKDK